MSDPIQDNPGVVAPPPLIYAGAFTIGLLLHRLFPARFLPKTAARPLGRLCTVTSGILALSALLEMRRAGTNVDPRQPATALVSKGPFRFTRNPLYLSLALLYTGMALRINSLWIIAMLPGALIAMRRGVINREEQYLERKFGEQYLSYKARVRRWI